MTEMTDALSQLTFLDQQTESVDWAPGPFVQDQSLTFAPTSSWPDPSETGWTARSIFNPSVIAVNDELHVFYRAAPRKESLHSRIGHASYQPNNGWADDPANPVVWPTLPNEQLGVEDPKIYRGDDGFVLFYNAIFEPTVADRTVHAHDGVLFEGVGCDINVATSPDLQTWTKLGPVTDRSYTRLWAKGAVIPRAADGAAVRIGGEYLMYVSEGCGGRLTVGRSDDLLHWRFEPQNYLDMSPFGGQLHEVATATVVEDRIVLDFFYSKDGIPSAARAEYAIEAPFTQRRMALGGTLAWGGLSQWDGRWIFAQGWDAPPDKPELQFYTANSHNQ